MSKRCINCDAYDRQDKFCYLRWQHMDPSEYCSNFKGGNKCIK